MIPEAKQAAVAKALHEAFGVNEFEDIRPLTGGMSSALVFRIVVKGNPYLLRLIMRTDAFSDPTREFECMRIASDAGIAPRIRYADITERILITDFVDAKPYSDDVAPFMASTLRRLHSLPQFPKAVSYFKTVDGFIRRFPEAKILPESATEEVFRRYAEVERVYPRNEADHVACHNDLKPQNTLFDGNRVWLVDWEAAFLNDRYTDLAVAANFLVKDEVQEEEYLIEYFGEPASEYRSARFYLMRQRVHMIYASCFMLLAASAGASIYPDLNAPEFRDFHQRVISGAVDLTDANAKVEYAKVHLNQVLRNMRTQRFEDALAVVAAHHGRT